MGDSKRENHILPRIVAQLSVGVSRRQGYSRTKKLSARRRSPTMHIRLQLKIWVRLATGLLFLVVLVRFCHMSSIAIHCLFRRTFVAQVQKWARTWLLTIAHVVYRDNRVGMLCGFAKLAKLPQGRDDCADSDSLNLSRGRGHFASYLRAYALRGRFFIYYSSRSSAILVCRNLRQIILVHYPCRHTDRLDLSVSKLGKAVHGTGGADKLTAHGGTTGGGM